MGLNDWIGAFGRARALDISHDLERGYEAALLIQSIELEHYNDRPVRAEIQLSIPQADQAQLLRRFRAALEICRGTSEALQGHRGELAGQELRQLQLIDSVLCRYEGRRSPLPALSRSPEVLPRSLLGVVDQVRRQLDPEAEANVVAGFRRRRDSTLVSLRILLLLVLVPVLTQQLSRTYVVSPLVDRFAPDNAFLTYPKPQLEERAAEKLRLFREEIEFDALLKGRALPSAEDLHIQ
ncbi:MAG: proton extrusion protein PcxA, partial [Synechococcaceae cyanobacterium]|nr:proton extrusion protein PcxA [Synechococcaceae cyanobacterium]